MTGTDESVEVGRVPERRGRVLLVAALLGVLSLLRFVPIVDDPWDMSLASTNASYYMAPMLKVWHRIGFVEMRGEPVLYALPSTPRYKEAYHHHPPLYPWTLYATTRLLGMSERGLRALSIVAISFATFLFVLLVARFGGLRRASLAGAAFLLAPMTLFFGWMPNPESLTLAAILLTLLAHDLLRGRRRLAYLPVHLCYALACLCDWQGAFAGPAIVLIELLRRDGRRLLRALLLAPTALSCIAATLLIFGWWQDDLAAGFSGIRTLSESSQAGLGLDLPDWWRSQGRFLRDLYGPVLLGLATLGALRSLLCPDACGRLLIALLCVGVLNVLVFRGHAFHHDFWWFYAAPGLALGAAVGAECLLRRAELRLVASAIAGGLIALQVGLHPVGLILLPLAMFLVAMVLRIQRPGLELGALVLLLVISSVQAHRDFYIPRNHYDFRRMSTELIAGISEKLDRPIGPRDLLFRSDRYGHESFYFRCWHLNEIQSPNMLVGLRTFMAHDSIDIDRGIGVFSTLDEKRFPELMASLSKVGRVIEIPDGRLVVIER